MATQANIPETPEIWGVIDLFGHTRIAGRISDQVLGGDSFVRVDIPRVGEIAEHTRLFGNKAIYSISFTSREIAEAVAANLQTKPISVYDFDEATRDRLKALPSPAQTTEKDDDYSGLEYDENDVDEADDDYPEDS